MEKNNIKTEITRKDIEENFYPVLNFNNKTDYAELKINYNGIEKLERNIEEKSECIIAYVHFEHGTNKLDDIYVVVSDNEHGVEDVINIDLSENELNLLKEIALESIQNKVE